MNVPEEAVASTKVGRVPRGYSLWLVQKREPLDDLQKGLVSIGALSATTDFGSRWGRQAWSNFVSNGNWLVVLTRGRDKEGVVVYHGGGGACLAYITSRDRLYHLLSRGIALLWVATAGTIVVESLQHRPSSSSVACLLILSFASFITSTCLKPNFIGK